MENDLSKIRAHRKDYSLVHTFGATAADVQSLPKSFSLYDGRAIPDQNAAALPFACTGEAGAFDSGLQDGTIYDPKDLYYNTPPFDQGGRDIREMFSTLIHRGPRTPEGDFGPKRSAYFNCYGSGPIDDFDAARIGVWLNQNEKRSVYVGSWWYPEFSNPQNGKLPTPSFNTSTASLHCYLITGFKSDDSGDYLEAIPWVGEGYGDAGKVYISRALFNALMAQPFTGAFTITKLKGYTPVPIGMKAVIDEFVYWFRHTFGV